MKNKIPFRPAAFFIILTAILLFSLSSCSSSLQNEQNAEASEKKHLNVITLNLFFPELQDRSQRLEDFANFIAQKKVEGEPIDIIMLQEVIGGLLSGTDNSSIDLKNLLAEKGLEYHLYFQLSNGLTGLLKVGNAILSAYEFKSTAYKTLPTTSEVPFGDFEVTLKQDVIMGTIEVPGSGRINIYNTHLCAYCESENRLVQIQALMDFIEEMETSFEGDNPVILGGDINTAFSTSEELSVYESVTNTYGFTDTYSAYNNCSDCCSPSYGYSGCTFAIPGNPYAINPFTDEQEEVTRLDYIFAKGIEAVKSSVVLDAFPWASDHSGILTEFRLD